MEPFSPLILSSGGLAGERDFTGTPAMMIPEDTAAASIEALSSPMVTPSANLLDHIEERVRTFGGEESCQTVELRRRGNAPVDARLFFKGREWITSPAGKEFQEDLAADPAVADIRPKGTTISIRFADAFIDALGTSLERGDIATLDASSVMRGTEYLVGFAGPNTSKALHIGHLRNISIGSALASMLSTAGAGVIRQSLVGDIGRNICEAMAGLRTFHPDGITADGKPDHHIGRCYARYIREYSSGYSTSEASDDPATRESRISNDLADEYMRGWLAGDPDVRELWRHTRDLVLEGQRQTLERFGVVIDHHDYESTAMEDLPELMEKGVAAGIVRRESDGTVVYDSGRPEFEKMVLLRSDGFPTEHARLLGVYYRIFNMWRDRRRYIDLAGTEWQPASVLHTELLERLRPELIFGTHILLFHGMVTLGSSKISSSEGEVPLIDDLLDMLDASPRILDLVACSGGTVSAPELSAIIIKSFFLCRPHMKQMEFSWDLLMGEENPGWIIAQAWCEVMKPETGEGEFDRDAYRLAVIRSQDFPRTVENAAETLSTAGLASYLLHFCEDFLATPSAPRIRAVVRTVLGQVMPSLGLVTPGNWPFPSTADRRSGTRESASE